MTATLTYARLQGPELAEEYGQPRVPVRKYGGHSGCAGARKRQRNTDHMMSGPDTSDGSAAGSYHAESGALPLFKNSYA